MIQKKGQGKTQRMRADVMRLCQNVFLVFALLCQIYSVSGHFSSSSLQAHYGSVKQSGFSDTIDKIKDTIDKVKKDIKKIQSFFQNLEQMGKEISLFFKKLDETIGLFTLFFLILVVFLGRILSFLGVPQGKGLFFTAMIMADLLLIWLHSHFTLSEEFGFKLMRAHFFLLMPFVLIWLIRWLKPRFKSLWSRARRQIWGQGSKVSMNTAHENWQTMRQNISLLQQSIENSLWEQRNQKDFLLSHDLREKMLIVQNDLNHWQTKQNEK